MNRADIQHYRKLHGIKPTKTGGDYGPTGIPFGHGKSGTPEHAAWFREYRRINRERMRAYYNKYNSDWRKKNGYHNEQKWKKKYPERVRAQEKLQRAVATGTVKKLPCVMCGSKKSVAHHEDYGKPLEVVWLCRAHHREIHYGYRKPIQKL